MAFSLFIVSVHAAPGRQEIDFHQGYIPLTPQYAYRGQHPVGCFYGAVITNPDSHRPDAVRQGPHGTDRVQLATKISLKLFRLLLDFQGLMLQMPPF
jgi:hypothetical protein